MTALDELDTATGAAASITSSRADGGSAGAQPASTASRTTRVLGWLSLLGVAVLLVFAFLVSPADSLQRDAVRLLYLHVPSAVLAYVAFAITGVGSIVYLFRRSRWWDHVAHASAEIGVVFCGVTLLTGVIWGRPVWNTWWEWGDVRIVTTLLLFLIFVGYLAFRSVPNEPRRQARNASVLAIIGALNIPIVNRSVEWWENRTLHQQSTLVERNIEDQTLVTLMIGFAVFAALFLWLLIHRFRVAWLAEEADQHSLDEALRQRRSEAGGRSEAEATAETVAV